MIDPVHPTDRRQARIHFYVNSSDAFYPTQEWPRWAQEQLYKQHKSNPERFNLFFFLTANGLEPHIAGTWVLMTDIKRHYYHNRPAVSEPISYGYDSAARKDIKELIKKSYNGTLYKKNKRVYNMHLKRPVLM